MPRYQHIIVTGTLSYDYIMDFPGRFADRIMPDKIHQISLSFIVDTLKREFGGTAGNIGYTLKLLGISPRIISCAGKDFQPYAQFLLSHGIDVSAIKISKTQGTSSYFVVTDREDNQIGSFYLGATKGAKSLGLFSGTDSVNRSFVVVSPTDPKAMDAYVRNCRERQIRYLYDPAFQIDTFTEEQVSFAISGAEVLIGNDYEIALIMQKLRMSKEDLLLMAPVVITTLGSRGSLIETRKESIYIQPAKPKRIVDPTGAGDAYRAGFLAGYVRGFDLPTCGRMGSVAAVYTVEKYGTVTHTFTLQDFLDRYHREYEHMISL
jgi:adenosine kinase